MKWILIPSEVSQNHRSRIGGKAYALSVMAKEGFKIPNTLILTVDVYNTFVSAVGLRERILLELNRKKFKDMRWEEIWDCATRIRNLFLKTSWGCACRTYSILFQRQAHRRPFISTG